MSVPLLDLKPQYDAIREELDAAVLRVVRSQTFILGPEVETLEAEMARFLGVPHAIACASGTDALLLALRALDPASGDEAVLPAFTFFATAGAAWNAGFRPVFCDIDPITYNITAALAEQVWSERTRVVIPVHLFGQMAPMEELNRLAHGRGAFVLEDAAQAIGATQRLVRGAPGDAHAEVAAGAAGDAGAFSFFPTKNLGGFGDGGMVSTGDAALADKVAKLRVHGGRQMYHHEMVGTNSRLDAIQAAVLRAKLPHLKEWTRRRVENAAVYEELLSGVDGIVLPKTEPGNEHVYNQYTIRAARRDDLRTHLASKGIGSGVYYPVPLHLQDCFSGLGGRRGQLPVSERACEEVLSLPIFPELGAGRLRAVADAIRTFYA